MSNFEYIKSLSVDELAEWLDQHGEFDGSPWATWFDENYCSKCEPVIGTFTDTGREIKLAWCELHDKCRFIDFIPDGKQIVKLWLDLKQTKCIEEELQEYIFDFCKNNNISIDLRFHCFGDINRFFKYDKTFSVQCAEYYVKDVQGIKNIMDIIITDLWEYKWPIYKVGLYIEDIVNKGNHFNVKVGACLLSNE